MVQKPQTLCCGFPGKWNAADLLILLTCRNPQLIEPLGQGFRLLQVFVCPEYRERFNARAVFVYCRQKISLVSGFLLMVVSGTMRYMRSELAGGV